MTLWHEWWREVGREEDEAEEEEANSKNFLLSMNRQTMKAERK
jgi:hypothetical protein